MSRHRVVVLGSTGSIGTSTLKVVRDHPDRFQIVGLAAGRSVDALLAQIHEFQPTAVALRDAEAAEALKTLLPPGCATQVFAGPDGVDEVASLDDVDVVVGGITGAQGLSPVTRAIDRGRRIALANKEVLVAAGAFVTRRAQETGSQLLPVDSEHSAIFQCLNGEDRSRVSRIILTASGGPFRGWARHRLSGVKPAEALKHPNWDMGAKITIDSSTLMNKGLEVIEARWLFDVDPDRIEVTVHPQSIVHSMVEFVDGSVIAQLGQPDMQLPIQYALAYPDRIPGIGIPRLDPQRMGPLTFEPPDIEAFPCLGLAYESLRRGQTFPTVLNAANEVAVERFLKEDIPYLGIPVLLETILEQHEGYPVDGIPAVLEADRWARKIAREFPANSIRVRSGPR